MSDQKINFLFAYCSIFTSDGGHHRFQVMNAEGTDWDEAATVAAMNAFIEAHPELTLVPMPEDSGNGA